MQQITLPQITKFLDDNSRMCLPSVETDVRTVLQLIKKTIQRTEAGYSLQVEITKTDRSYYTLLVYCNDADEEKIYMGSIRNVGNSALSKVLDADLLSCTLRFGLPINVTLAM